jgi:hypothetical protein
VRSSYGVLREIVSTQARLFRRTAMRTSNLSFAGFGFTGFS